MTALLPTPPHVNKSVDVALAEFVALRTVISNSRTTQGALVGIALTAFGLIFTFSLQDAPKRSLLFAVAPLAVVITVLYLGETFRVLKVGDYIRLELWPYLQEQTGYAKSWELFYLQSKWTLTRVLRAIALDYAVPVLLGASAVAALWSNWCAASTLIRTVESIAIAFIFAAPVGLAIAPRRS
jgi:hypothetical protein